MFSQPVSTAIGDTNKYVPTAARRDKESGDVITEPRNFYTTKGKSGKTAGNVYFMKSSFIAVGDTFKAAAVQSLKSTVDRDVWTKAGHDKNFRPARHVKERLYTASYPHGDEPPAKKQDYRNAEENGAVMTGPRNFLTNPMKRGKVGRATSFGGAVPYTEDDYDIKKKIAMKERRHHVDKIQEIHDAKHFSQKAKRKEYFNSHLQVYEENPPIPARPEKKEPERVDIHDGKKFKPSNPPKRGNHCTLEKFPLYQEDPPTQLKRKQPVEGEEDPPGFKPTTKYSSLPSPSVATNIRNLKSSFPASFARSPIRS